MKRLRWRVASGPELSQLLREATLHESAAVGNATVYRLGLEGSEQVAIALPDGQVVVIDPELVRRTRRRRPESSAAMPAVVPEKPAREA